MSSVPWSNETERADYYNALYNNQLVISAKLEYEVEKLKRLLSESELKKFASESFELSKKIRAIYPHIVVDGNGDKPYYSIHWFDVEGQTMCCGYSSFNLRFVREWLEDMFEVVEEDVGDFICRQETEIERLKKLLTESEQKTVAIAKAFYREGIKDIAGMLKEMAEKEKIIVIDGKWAVSQATIDKAKKMLIGEDE